MDHIKSRWTPLITIREMHHNPRIASNCDGRLKMRRTSQKTAEKPTATKDYTADAPSRLGNRPSTGNLVGRGLIFSIVLLTQACTGNSQPSTNDETFDTKDGQDIFRGTSSNTALSPDELSTYFSDRLYVRSLASRDKAIKINHADPRQHRFVLARLRLVGKNPANSPQLFKAIENLKTAQEAQGLTSGSVEILATATDGSLASQHALMPSAPTNPIGAVTSGAMASRKDHLNYGYVDSGVWDDLGNQLGNMTFLEVFGDMPHHVTQSVGSDKLAKGAYLEGDSLLQEDVMGSTGLVESYIVSSPTPLPPRPLPLAMPVLRVPRDMVIQPLPEANTIKICLERGSPIDCDYYNAHNGVHELLIPFTGSIRTSAPNLVFDTAAIQHFADGTAPAPGAIYATLGTTGGGCTLTSLAMRTFWAGVTATATLLAWDFTGDQTRWLNFSASCALIDREAYFTANLANIPIIDTNTGLTQTGNAFITNEPGYTPPAYSTYLMFSPELSITNSCLAEGTRITIGDHNTRTIENLHRGDQVSNPFVSTLTITDVIVGTEHNPMIRIRDDREHELLLTETHPLYVEGRGMVPAKLLNVGDHVKTDQGPSQLISVTRESYTGRVYNLKVGDTQEMVTLQPNQTAMYANGFLVGDAQIQAAYDFAAAKQQHAKRGKLPMRWHDDYMTSLKQANQVSQAR